MKRLLVALTIFLSTSAYALVGSFYQNDREYGLTDELYSVEQLGNISLPEGCSLIPCSEVSEYLDNLTYPVDYLICDNGIFDVSSKKECSIVELSGKKYVRCGGDFLPENQKFRAFVSCSIFSDSEDEEGSNSTEETPYLNFTPEKDAYYCSKDKNGNGFFDEEGEIQKCLDTDNGEYICPIDKVACEATYEQPLCPEGTLNTQRHMCQADATIKCPSGYTWDSSIDKCVLTPTCPDGGVLNTVRDRCEKTVINECPEGYTYDSVHDICVKSVDCGNGVFIPERNRCEKSVTLTCPAGYTLVGNKCVADPACPSGTTYNPTYNKCVESFTKDCPSGYTYNPSTDRCEANPVCPSGFTYNRNTNRCEKQADNSYRCSSNGQTYSSLTTCQTNCKVSGSCSGSLKYEYCHGIVQCPWGDYPNEIRNPNVPLPSSPTSIPECPYGGGDYNIFVYLGGDWICHLILAKQVSSYTCSLNGQSYSDLSTCQANCVTTGTCSQVGSCPSGSVLSNGICVANPSCPSGGTFDGNADVCWTNYTPVCPTGTTYDSNANLCVATPTCSSGTLNPDTDKCELVANADCGGWTYDSNLNVCYSSPVCSYGLYNEDLHKCVATVSRNCGTYTYDSVNKVCYLPVKCPVDTAFSLKDTIGYSAELDKCVSDAEHICPSGDTYTYTWNRSVLKCELVPICKDGVFTPETNGCYVGDLTCPLGDYPCLPVNGKNYCSPNPCEQWSSALEYDDTQEGANDKQADGQVDENGCHGTIYIFNGNDYRCRPPGLQTGGSDCCKKTTTWFGLGQCTEREKILAKLRSWGKLDGQCHYVGSYCAVKALGICLQKKKTYCCFHSVLARIIQEQGRKQLGISWGDPKSPNCRGFTPDEFQRIDFSKIDFSEWYSEVQRQAAQGLDTFKTEGVQKIKDYYNQLLNYSK